MEGACPQSTRRVFRRRIERARYDGAFAGLAAEGTTVGHSVTSEHRPTHPVFGRYNVQLPRQ
eukprot:7901431-Pyramimonas_sp.AAC.1